MSEGSCLHGIMEIRGGIGGERIAAAAMSAAGQYVGFPRDRIMDIFSAVAEAVLNAHEHGNASDPDLYVFIRFRCSKRAVYISVGDLGRGFKPSNLRCPSLGSMIDVNMRRTMPERGWGFFLMSRLADEISVRQGKKRFWVRMTFRNA